MLKDLDALCNELGLKYFIAYGSLIGAVRHKGFIPWD
ncbi:LicD family protein, partial [Ligilactobacillus agilis]